MGFRQANYRQPVLHATKPQTSCPARDRSICKPGSVQFRSVVRLYAHSRHAYIRIYIHIYKFKKYIAQPDHRQPVLQTRLYRILLGSIGIGRNLWETDNRTTCKQSCMQPSRRHPLLHATCPHATKPQATSPHTYA